MTKYANDIVAFEREAFLPVWRQECLHLCVFFWRIKRDRRPMRVRLLGRAYRLVEGVVSDGGKFLDGLSHVTPWR